LIVAFSPSSAAVSLPSTTFAFHAAPFRLWARAAHEIGAAVASEFIRLAWLSEKFGQDPGLALSELDDRCPTVPKRSVASIAMAIG
jgi:hypothetical protein